MRERKHTIEEMQKFAEQHEGICLSKEYNYKQVIFECREGHKWRSNTQSVLNGHWCRECANIAKRKDGKKMEYRPMRNTIKE